MLCKTVLCTCCIVITMLMHAGAELVNEHSHRLLVLEWHTLHYINVQLWKFQIMVFYQSTNFSFLLVNNERKYLYNIKPPHFARLSYQRMLKFRKLLAKKSQIGLVLYLCINKLPLFSEIFFKATTDILQLRQRQFLMEVILLTIPRDVKMKEQEEGTDLLLLEARPLNIVNVQGYRF